MTVWEMIEQASIDEFGMPIADVMKVIIEKYAPTTGSTDEDSVT